MEQSNAVTYSVIPNISRCGTQMDDWGSGGADSSKGMHMSHHVMPPFLLLFSSVGKINVRDVGLHGSDLVLGDVKAESLKKVQTTSK